jgi:hypothetical protein
MLRVFLVLALVLVAVVPSHAQDGMPVVGQRYPQLTLPALGTDKPVSLADYHGKKVLLIHFASW